MHLQTVVSAGRPHSPELWASKGLDDLIWVVPEDEWDAYKAHGANHLVAGSREGVSKARNAALELCSRQGAVCVMLDDDPATASEMNFETRHTEAVSWRYLIGMVVAEREQHDVVLAAANHIGNPFHINRPLSFNTKVAGCVLAIAPTDLRFDERLSIGEDLDFALQVACEYGRYARVDRLIATFERAQTGGVSYTKAEQQRCLSILMKKWGDRIRHKPSAYNPWNVMPNLPRQQRVRLG